MKVLLLIYHLIIKITIIHASNQYLGCFIDQIGSRDLNIFIGDYEQLTPKQCILACREQNFRYAAIQYGNECRCGQQYGKYGQVSDDECDYLCSTAEKCGGDYRNSVYNVINLADQLKTGFTCQNNFLGYQGCFDSFTLSIRIDMVNSIEDCIERCGAKYNYAGIMKGNLCYCGNDINHPSLNSNLCHIRCHKNPNDCCGGLHALSVYNTKHSQSSLLSEKLIRVKRANAANATTHSTHVTSVSTPLKTVSLKAITSHTSSLPISSKVSSSLKSSTTVTQSISTIHSTTKNIPTTMNSLSMMSKVTSTTPISSTNTRQMLTATSYMRMSTAPTLTHTSMSVTIIPNSTSSISSSQSSTNHMSSVKSSSTYSATSHTSIPSSSHTSIPSSSHTSIPSSSHTSIPSSSHTSIPSSSHTSIPSSSHTSIPSSSHTSIPSSSHMGTSEALRNTATAISSPSSSHTNISHGTSMGTTSSLNTISSETSSHTHTTISTNPISSISYRLAVTLTSTHQDTTQSVTPSNNHQSSSISSIQSTSSINSQTSLPRTTTIVPTSSKIGSTASTYLSQKPMSSTPTSPSSIASHNPSSFSTIMTTESNSISSIRSTLSSQVTATTSQQTNSESSTSHTSFFSTNSRASSSANLGIQTTITSSVLTGITVQTTVTSPTISSAVRIITTPAVNSTSQAAVNSNSQITVNSTSQSTANSTSPTTTTTAVPSSVISTVILVPINQNFSANDNTTVETIRIRLSDIINLAFQCLTDSSYPNCTQSGRRKKRQLCSTGYDVELVTPITELPSTATSRRFLVEYTVSNPCNQNALISPVQVRTATDTLSQAQIIRMLGYDYEGDLIRSTTIGNTDTPTTDKKLWIIGAVLGPVAFALLLIFVFCYLHYKCRPRPTNRSLAKVISNPSLVSPRTTNYEPFSNEPVKQIPTVEKNIHVLTQNDVLVGASTSSRRLTPTESEKSTTHPPEYGISNEISMDAIRRQNDVERWRNKLRLQEKFQQSSIGIQDPSMPNTARSYDNRAFVHDPSQINIQPTNEIVSIHSPRPLSKTPELEVGRTKLHRLLDEVLDKADSEEIYNPDSDYERQKRRRQQRRIHSISNGQSTVPLEQQIPHIPVIPQVSERPDPSLVRLRYNPYEAGDRAHDISRFTPVELKPKYTTDDQRSTQYSSRSNPPLFYDDSTIADRAATATNAYAHPKRLGQTRLETDREAVMRHDGGQIDRRLHKFHGDAVYVDSISKNHDGYRVQARSAWVEPETDHDSYGKTDYVNAKRSAANTRNLISSIYNELQHTSAPSSEDYHA